MKNIDSDVNLILVYTEVSVKNFSYHKKHWLDTVKVDLNISGEKDNEDNKMTIVSAVTQTQPISHGSLILTKNSGITFYR